MALKKGICKNYGNCHLADNVEIQEVDSSEFICTNPDCGKELYEYKGPGPSPFPLKLFLIIVTALLLIGGGVWTYFRLIPKESGGKKESVSLSLNKEKISLYVGESETLKATVQSQSEDKNVSLFFTSDNENVVQVDRNGTILAVSKGEANITVVAQMETGIADTAIAKIIVQKESVSLTLNKDALNLNTGESETLKATIHSQPEDKDVSLFFTSDNKNVAHVDNEGTVLAVSKGEANITVVAQMEAYFSDTVYVKVTVNELPEEPKYKPIPEPKNTYWGTYNLGWGTYEGEMKNGKPADGVNGEIKVTKDYSIDLKDGLNNPLIVKRGDVIVNPKFKNGEFTLHGELHSKDGKRRTF